MESFYEEGEHWLNITPNESNIVNQLPDFDFESTVYLYSESYIGVFDTTKNTFLWQKVQLPKQKIHSFAIGQNALYYTVMNEMDEKNIPTMTLYKADMKKLMNNEPDAVKIMSDKTMIGSMHTFNNALIIQAFSDHLYVWKTGDEFLTHYKPKALNLDEDDFLFCIKGFHNNILYQTRKGRVFKCSFKEDLSGLKSFTEITNKM